MGMNQTFESFPELEDRTAEEIRWLVPTDSLDAGLNTSNENLIMEVYDTNGNIMLRWDFGSEEGMMGIGMTFYDEDGNEIDGMGGGQMPSGGEMPEGM